MSLDVVDPAGAGARVEVTGLDASHLPEDPGSVLSVHVLSQPDVAILGEVDVDGSTLVFRPRYPFTPGLSYRAIFAGDRDALDLVFTVPDEKAGPPAAVEAVYPSGDELPANLLKFYVHFTAPMSRGEAYERLALLDESGTPLELPFLELDEELWDAEQTRFTLLFDPGRVKRGLAPNEEEGAPLEPDRAYTLVVDAAWRDAHGRPLARGFEKPFRTTAPDRERPDPERWTIEAPQADTREPLVVTFDEPLDHALLLRVIRVADVAGEVAVEDGERRWRFTPARPWRAGEHELHVETVLEDRAGNSLGRSFETSGVSELPDGEIVLTFRVGG